MSKNQSNGGFDIVRWLRKFTVSAFVICTFIAYALHQHVMNPLSAAISNPPAASADTGQPFGTPPAVLSPAQSSSGSAPFNNPGPAPTATPNVRGQYRDGQYTGSSYNVFWGNMQVKAIIQNGKLANVQIVQYPSDRRTSQRINQQAIPMLTQEVMQAQNASVDFISGATLTSEGYLQSLQDALDSARS